MADKRGVVLRLKGTDCHMLGQADELFDYPPDEISTTVLQALAKDAVCRYSLAFGDKQKLTNALVRQHIRVAAFKSSIFKDAFAASPMTCK